MGFAVLDDLSLVLLRYHEKKCTPYTGDYSPRILILHYDDVKINWNSIPKDEIVVDKSYALTVTSSSKQKLLDDMMMACDAQVWTTPTDSDKIPIFNRNRFDLERLAKILKHKASSDKSSVGSDRSDTSSVISDQSGAIATPVSPASAGAQ